ncbi:MAG TPA: hypothetical protein VIV40_29755 [Kofleriaceae bacterium]
MKRLCLLMLLATAACQPAPVGVRDVEVPRDATPQCGSLCAGIGLPLDSVVIMANNVGCVCRASAPPATTAPAASASAGGMAAIMIADEAARQQAARNAAQASKPK